MVGFAVGEVSLYYQHGPQRAGTSRRRGLILGITGRSLLGLSVFTHRWLGITGWPFFLSEIPDILLVFPGLPLMGFVTIRLSLVSTLGAWLLALSVPGAILLTVLFGHLSGGLLVLDLAWIVIGSSLLSKDR